MLSERGYIREDYDEWKLSQKNTSTFTDSARKIDKDNPLFLKRHKVKQTPIKRIEDFNVGDVDGKPTFKKGVFNEYNVDGAMIYALLMCVQMPTVAAVMQGFKNVGVKDKNRLLRQ